MLVVYLISTNKFTHAAFTTWLVTERNDYCIINKGTTYTYVTSLGSALVIIHTLQFACL